MIAALALSLALAAPAGCGLPPLAAGERPWGPGESLDFDLDLLGVVKAGSMQLAVEPPISGGKVIPLRARARTEAAVGDLKKLAAVGISWVDARTLRPERYKDDADEGGVRRSTDTRIRAAPEPVVMLWETAGRKGQRVLPREGELLDAVSAVYYLRAARLAPGDRFCFDVVGRGRLYRVEGEVAREREKVDTPAGRFDTLRLDATASRPEEPSSRPLGVHLWLSADGRRLLVAGVGELDFGPVRAMLSSVRGARR